MPCSQADGVEALGMPMVQDGGLQRFEESHLDLEGNGCPKTILAGEIYLQD